MLTDEARALWKRLGTDPEFMQLDATFGQFRLRIHDDVPSFMEVPIAYEPEGLAGADVAFLGIPFEGWRHFGPTIWFAVDTVGTHRPEVVMGTQGSAMAPDYLRHWAIHYSIHVGGGFCPEVSSDFRLVDHLAMRDYGNVDVVQPDGERTARRAVQMLADIVRTGAIPMILGGDHMVPYPAVKAINDNSPGKTGMVVFDSHYDNMYGGEYPAPYDVFARLNGANWSYRIFDECDVAPDNTVFIGIKGGAFNTRLMHELSAELGIAVFTIADVERLGIEEVTDQAITIATRGTDRVYVSLDVDSMDPISMPAQKYPDPFGLQALQVRYALRQLATRTALCGFDMNCMSPTHDAGGRGALTACRLYLEVLKGIAIRKCESARSVGTS